MGVVLSVNVGMPRDVAWRGKTVRTGIWKQPVQGRVFARRLNLVGDGQGDLNGHGGEQRAVMVYQIDSYRHWAAHLRRDDLTYGCFGENLTVDGLPDDEVCIGDRFRIGGAVFEVTQPRVTCYRVGLRLDRPDMPALLVSHRRPGFYLRVIEEGEVGAGDVIEKIADGPERMTVAEIDALLYSPEHPIEALRRATRIPALSPGWQRSMRSLLEAAEHGVVGGNVGLTSVLPEPLAWPGFRTVSVLASSQESADVRTFELGAADGTALPPSLPGQHIVVRLRPDPDGPPIARNYSLCGPPAGATYQIAVKNEGGALSSLLHAQVRAGGSLEISAPRGAFTLNARDTPLVLLSAGVGITPVLAMLRAAAAPDAATRREVWWLHSARDRAHHSFAGVTRDLVRRIPRGHHWTIYSRPGADDRRGVDFDAEGRLSVPRLQEMGVPRDGDFYLCGPAQFLEDMQAGLKAWGIERSCIHTEPFGPAPARTPGIATAGDRTPHQPDGAPGTGPLVAFARSGLSVRWDERFASLLELAEACAIPVRWACRTGVCHNCESGLIDGRVDYAPEPLDAPADGRLLICCTTPKSAVTLDL
ncbi:MAG TPA: MOSC and FAD-binding oxidoreductase domain-containing protein [Candidatus Sulfotelmatobacter sp.]|nr:MOSC and FAD-binding oxidoreductase domain-containing protein [Candidatus Sulfotelmatobacter sp.]